MKIVDRVLDSLGLFEEEELEEVAEEQQAAPQKERVSERIRRSGERTSRRFSDEEELEPVRLMSSRRSRKEKENSTPLMAEPQSEAPSSRILGQNHVMLTTPKNFESAQEIADHMRDGRAVLMNFEGTDYELARRIVDFISGVAYALDGNIKKVGQGVFLCAPKGVEITYDVRSTFKGTDTAEWDDRDFEKYFNR